MHKLELDISANGCGTVTLDGKPINARAVTIATEVGKATSVRLEIVDIEVKGAVRSAEVSTYDG